jgi:hypothetical protein
MAKNVKIVRSINAFGKSKVEITRYFILYPHCSPALFLHTIHYIFGSAYSTNNYIPVFTTSNGLRFEFSELEDGETYYLTFERGRTELGSERESEVIVGERLEDFLSPAAGLEVILPETFLS